MPKDLLSKTKTLPTFDGDAIKMPNDSIKMPSNTLPDLNGSSSP